MSTHHHNRPARRLPRPPILSERRVWLGLMTEVVAVRIGEFVESGKLLLEEGQYRLPYEHEPIEPDLLFILIMGALDFEDLIEEHAGGVRLNDRGIRTFMRAMPELTNYLPSSGGAS